MRTGANDADRDDEHEENLEDRRPDEKARGHCAASAVSERAPSEAQRGRRSRGPCRAPSRGPLRSATQASMPGGAGQYGREPLAHPLRVHEGAGDL